MRSTTRRIGVVLAAIGLGLIGWAGAPADESEPRLASATSRIESVSATPNPMAVNAAYEWGKALTDAWYGAAWANDVDALAAELERQAAEQAEAERQRQAAAARPVARASAPQSSGGGCGVPADTGAPPPAGFPDYVIEAESGGSTTASNGSHFGRAQISCQHYGSNGGCVGMSYAQCWEKLWAGGAGASNWEQTL